MTDRNYGKSASGKVIDETVIEEFVDDAERGYEPGQLRGKPRGRGRPPLGSQAKTVESVRLDPGLRDAAADRAARDGVTTSEVIRRALREYLRSA